MDAATRAARAARCLGKPLAPKQQAVWDLKQQGKMNKEIAAILGVSVPYVGKTMTAVYRKLGISAGPTGGKVMPNTSGVEHRDPEAAAAMLDAGTDPLVKVKDALAAAGMPDRVSEAMLKRLRVKFFGAVHEIKALKTQELVRMCEEKLGMIGFYLDDKVMAEASARDLGLMAGVLIEKRQLLRGEPTQIISDHERKKLNELLPLAIAEAQRRGLTLQGQVTEKVVGPA
jgi:DNA-binding CsgD family transcriptional regulator